MYGDYIVISLICGVVCFLFAKEKGKNPILWFIIGLVLSILAILIIALIKKKINKKKENNPSSYEK